MPPVCLEAPFRLRISEAAGLDDAALRDRMRPVLAVNMGALALSMVGLLLVITGIVLG